MRCILILLALSFLTATDGIAAEGWPLDVSLVNLIASPKDYDGKRVRVIGYVRFEFEGNAVYLHQEDFQRRLAKNGLWLDVDAKARPKQREVNNGYALVEGVFSMKNRGHLGLYSGAIEQIEHLQAWTWPDRSDAATPNKSGAAGEH